MTAGIDGRIAKLEQRIAPPEPDLRRREAALAELTRLINDVVDSLARGEPPRCEVAHAIVGHHGDVEAALREIFDHRHDRQP
jgi:hypothetical protein